MTGSPSRSKLAHGLPAIGNAAGFGTPDGSGKQTRRPRSASGRFVSPKPSIELLAPWKEPDAQSSNSEAPQGPLPANAKVPATTRSPVSALRVTRPLPRFIKSALAGLMVACGDLECSMEAAACRAMGIEPHHWRLIAVPGLGPKIRILRALEKEQDFGQSFAEAETRIWPWVEAIDAVWTTIVHQRLFMLDQSKLLAGALPDNGADPEYRVFPLERLQQLETIALSLADIFQRVATRFESARSHNNES